MTRNSLEQFIERIRKIWGPIQSDTVLLAQKSLENLAKAPVTEDWLASLLRDLPDERELYRDPDHGFVLLAHVEKEGRYRVPHDHGSGWVVYAVQSGEMEMGEYRRYIDPKGNFQLVKRESYRMRAGNCRVYLPEDIHDTTCVVGPVLMFRFSSCDLKMESREGRMIRYME